MYDYSQETKTFELANTGIYELAIETAELKNSSTGKAYMGLTIVIRDDVEQPFAGVKIWKNIWKNVVHRSENGDRITKANYEKMTPAQKASVITTEEYDDFMIRKLIHAQDCDKTIKDENGNDIPNPNYQTSFDNIEEVALFLNGLCFQAKVLKTMDDNTGNERNDIDFKTVKRTSVPQEQAQNTPVEDDDLPF